MRAFKSLLCVACVLVVGCAGTTQGQQESQKINSQVSNFGKAAESTELEIRTAIVTLTSMIESEGGDLNAPYKKFAASVNKSDKQITDLKTRIAKMDAAAATYFQTYEGDLEKIASEDMRESRRKRLEAARANYQALSQHANGIVTASEPLIATLKDVSTALGLELNPGSVQALKANADKLGKMADDWYKRIAEIKADAQKWQAETAPTVAEGAGVDKEAGKDGGEAAKK